MYSWNWELPLHYEQVLRCAKTPPPELTRQQEALAAATAAAAAAAAVTAGAAPDAIPSLPVVARMATLLGKRQHQQLSSLPPMPMAPNPIMYAPMAVDSMGSEAAAMSAAAAAAAEPASAAAAAAAAVSGGDGGGGGGNDGAAEGGVHGNSTDERVSRVGLESVLWGASCC